MPHIPQSLSQLLKGVEAEANAANPPEFVKALKWSILRAVSHDVFRNVRAKVEPVRKHFCTFTIDANKELNPSRTCLFLRAQPFPPSKEGARDGLAR